MAVDTRDKRMSIMSASLPWRGVYPLADGTVDTADRLIFPYFYSGIAAAGAAGGFLLQHPGMFGGANQRISGGMNG